MEPRPKKEKATFKKNPAPFYVRGTTTVVAVSKKIKKKLGF
jgi:hypothetical protein